MGNIPKEKRHFTRIVTDVVAALDYAGDQVSVQLLDISLNGVLIEQPAALTLANDAIYHLTLQLGEETITLELKLVHRAGNHLGFTISHIDLDSISHLRRMMELNIGDPEELERELSELAHSLG